MTIRASYGMFTDRQHLFYLDAYANDAPYGNNITLANVNLSNPWATYPGGNPFPFTLSKNTTFPLAAAYVSEFIADVAWGELDLLLVDLPPGAAADKPPAIANFIPDLDGAVVVTTPSEVTGDVVRKSIKRPTEKLPDRLRASADTWGCGIPRVFPASVWVRPRSLMMR